MVVKKNNRVMVVDDDEGLRSIVQLGLESHGYDVETFSSYTGAFLNLHKYRAFVLDYQIPGGITGGVWLRENADIVTEDRRVLMSGSDFWNGTPGYHLTKPFSIIELVKCIDSMGRYKK